jgi:hypothetical protein
VSIPSLVLLIIDDSVRSIADLPSAVNNEVTFPAGFLQPPFYALGWPTLFSMPPSVAWWGMS